MNSEYFTRHRPLLTQEQWNIIRTATYVVAGAGGLGSHVLDLLVRLGVTRLEVWDSGILDEPDLNRQSLYTRGDLGKPKVLCAEKRLRAIHPDITIEPVLKALTEYDSPGKSLGGADVCFDCLDSFSARAGLETALVRVWEQQNRPGLLVHGAVSGYYGQAAVLFPPSFGYTDLLGAGYAGRENPPKPVMPHSAALVASVQVGEFIRFIGESENQRDSVDLIALDGRTFQSEVLRIKKPE